MPEEQRKFTGGCLCGAVRYEASGDPASVIFCHCESCRKHTGAPVVALAGFKLEQVRFTLGDRAIYESTPGVKRGFCGRCGTPLTWEGDGEELGPLIEIHVGTTDDPNEPTPEPADSAEAWSVAPEDAAGAHRRLEAGGTRGRCVLRF